MVKIENFGIWQVHKHNKKSSTFCSVFLYNFDWLHSSESKILIESTWKSNFAMEQLCWTLCAVLCSALLCSLKSIICCWHFWHDPCGHLKRNTLSSMVSGHGHTVNCSFISSQLLVQNESHLQEVSLAISDMTSLWNVTSTWMHRPDWKTENNWSHVWHLPCSFGRWKCCKLWLRRFP